MLRLLITLGGFSALITFFNHFQTAAAGVTCQARNETAANEVARKCRKQCYVVGDRRCKAGTVCLCDQECGMSCIRLTNYCPRPRKIALSRRIIVTRKANNGSHVPVLFPPYKYNDTLQYQCAPGYKQKFVNSKQFCHGRRNWTKTSSFCIRACSKRHDLNIGPFGLKCGNECDRNSDCPDAKLCLCDGNCGRSCVDPDTDCGSAESSSNCAIEYTERGIHRVAHYVCDEGFYLHSGSPFRKCTGAGRFDGTLAVCKRVKCGNPVYSIRATGGEILDNEPVPYYVGDRVTFTCPPTHRLLGYSNRTCENSGQWGGVLAACDVKDNFTRCPHPGVPVNGRLLTIERNFSVGSVVEFECDRGYLMQGDAQQECLYFLQWSDGGAPKCFDPTYADQHFQGIDRFLRNIKDLQSQPAPRALAGRSAHVANVFNHELYFVIDATRYHDPFHERSAGLLDESVDVLINILSEIAQKDKAIPYDFSIVVYGAKVRILQHVNTDNISAITEFLLEVKADRENLQEQLGSPSNLYDALATLERIMVRARRKDGDTKRAVYVTVNGEINRGSDIYVLMQRFLGRFKDNAPDFSVIISCLDCKRDVTSLSHDVLHVATSPSHVLVNKDAYRFKEFLRKVETHQNDTVTDACGLAGNVGSLKKSRSTIGRVIHGNDAQDGAWPWQVVILMGRYLPNKIRQGVYGGGSIINNQWVLTAAHIFRYLWQDNPDWFLRLRVLMGTTDLIPYSHGYSTLKVYQPQQIFIHPKYKNFDYDAALVRLGREYVFHEGEFVPHSTVGWVNYTRNIKPVCLPCMKGSCLRQQDSGARSPPNVQCANEGMELSRTRDTSIHVVTGFGHTSPISDGEFTFLTDFLQQGVVRVKSNKECNASTKYMNTKIPYTSRMLCAIGDQGQVVDACSGDSGSPLVREVFDQASKSSCWLQVGIVSWGYGCADNYTDADGNKRHFPGFYTDVFTIIPWIRSLLVPSTSPEVEEVEGKVGNIMQAPACQANHSLLEPGRICRKSCKLDSDCPVKKKCLCDGACGIICFNPNAFCVEPSLLANGRIIGEKTYGKSVTYKCNPGYKLIGQTNRTCRSDKKWSGKAPVCQRLFCRELQPILNGRVKGERGVGDVMRYSCNPGFQIVGNAIRRCQADFQWNGTTPSCRAMTCTKLSITNGRVRGGQAVDDVASFSCDPGFRLSKNARLVCRADGQWIGTKPMCLRIICAILPRLLNGNILGERRIGQSVTYSCGQDFSLNGSRTRTCLKDGSWTGNAPTCERITCYSLQPPQNGKVFGGRKIGRSVTYSCDGNFQLIGSNTRTCLANGTWTGRPPICKRIFCAILPRLSNGFILGERRVGQSVTHTCRPGFTLAGRSTRTCLRDGSWTRKPPKCKKTYPAKVYSHFKIGRSVTYSCYGSFSLIVSNTRTCLADGTWTGRPTTCKRIICAFLPRLLNGNVLGQRRIGQSVTHICGPGFSLSGSRTRTCLKDGSWTGNAPTCEALSCPHHPPFENGKVEGSLSYASIATFTCNAGFRIVGNATRRCQSDGQWSETEPSCVASSCSLQQLPIANGFIGVSSSVGPGGTSQSVIYRCGNGYTLIGEKRRTCLSNGLWSGKAPSCQRRFCPEILPLKNGFLIGGNLLSPVASFTCFKGYILRGSKKRFCSNGRWSGIMPNCKKASCPEPVPLLNGEFKRDKSNSNLVVYSCNKPFTLRGNNTRECLAGTWSGFPPSCVLPLCPALRPIENGNVLLYADVAVYSCDEGFFLNKPTHRYCKQGVWVGDDPSCLVAVCPPLAPIANGRFNFVIRRSYNSLSYTTFLYTCNEGYQLRGSTNSRSCVAGNWTGEVPTCEEKKRSCPLPQRIPNGRVEGRGSTVGETISYVCQRGYRMRGNTKRTCQLDLSWSGTTPSCYATSCGRIPPIENGRAVGASRIGSAVSYICDEGFLLSGNAKIYCLRSGGWAAIPPLCRRGCLAAKQMYNAVPQNHKIVYRPEDRVTYVCKNGGGTSTEVTCLSSGAWSEFPPNLCQGDVCEKPTTPQNARAFSYGDQYAVGSVVDFTCDRGYQQIGEYSFITCSVNGTWIGEYINCQAIQCSAPLPPENGLLNAGLSNFTYKSQVAYSCLEGFKLVGNATGTCDENGTWGEVPECIGASQCPSIPTPTNGSSWVRSGINNTPGTILLFECNLGYVLRGSATTICQEDFTWSKPAPICEERGCRVTSLPTGVRVDYFPGRDYGRGETLSYNCSYRETPANHTITCVGRNKWNPRLYTLC